MAFPTPQEVEQASREQLARWVRNLTPDAEDTKREQAQRKIIARISARFDALGGWTPELSKKVGYGA